MDTLKILLNQNNFDYDNILNICKGEKFILKKINHNDDFSIKTLTYLYDKNLHISFNEHYLNISLSLSKFYHGNSIKNMSFFDIVKALDKLSSLLNTDLRIGKIKRLDLAFNLLMNHYVFQYLQSIEQPEKYFRKDVHGNGNTVTLVRGNSYDREVYCFYSKFDQSNRKEKKDKNLFGNNKNMLRFETRLEGKLLVEKFGDLIVDDLYNEQTYLCLMEWWYESYKSIPKSKEPQQYIPKITTPTNFMIWLANEGARLHGGKHKLLSIVKNSSEDAKKKYPIRKRIHREISDEIYVDEDLMKELDDKIEERYNAEITSWSFRKNAA